MGGRRVTYSACVRDPSTGALGVAVQSHWFSVGSVVSWASARVGVVATQAFAEPAHGERGLMLFRAGLAPDQVLVALAAGDPEWETRQVGVVRADGRAAAHTGARCIAEASSLVGDGWTCQANMMRSPGVPEAMAEVLGGSSDGALPERLLGVLDAAEAAGGDVRGRQSAALVVVSPEGDRLDLRVEEHPEPLAELRRLVGLRRAYDAMEVGDDFASKGDVEGALLAYGEAGALAPDAQEVRFWQGVTLAGVGRDDEARDVLRPVLAADGGRWAELLTRLPAAGLLPEGFRP